MQHADQKYIEALLNHDEILLREIYKRFGDTVRKMVLLYNGHETDAADIMQDALLSVLNRARKGGFILTCPFEGFLYLICKRKWIKELQKRNKFKVTIDREETFYLRDGSAEVAEEFLLYEDRKALVEQMVEKLGPSCRELLYLSWENHPMEEVAAMLNISYGYARKKKTSCMAKLISLIQESPEYDFLKQ